MKLKTPDNINLEVVELLKEDLHECKLYSKSNGFERERLYISIYERRKKILELIMAQYQDIFGMTKEKYSKFCIENSVGENNKNQEFIVEISKDIPCPALFDSQTQSILINEYSLYPQNSIYLMLVRIFHEIQHQKQSLCLANIIPQSEDYLLALNQDYVSYSGGILMNALYASDFSEIDANMFGFSEAHKYMKYIKRQLSREEKTSVLYKNIFDYKFTKILSYGDIILGKMLSKIARQPAVVLKVQKRLERKLEKKAKYLIELNAEIEKLKEMQLYRIEDEWYRMRIQDEIVDIIDGIDNCFTIIGDDDTLKRKVFDIFYNNLGFTSVQTNSTIFNWKIANTEQEISIIASNYRNEDDIRSLTSDTMYITQSFAIIAELIKTIGDNTEYSEVLIETATNLIDEYNYYMEQNNPSFDWKDCIYDFEFCYEILLEYISVCQVPPTEK